jgi:uncharacterized phiE125 gp8 family phage protein
VAEPLTLDEALTHLREVADDGENDAYITGLISTAREACEKLTERTLITTPWLLTLDAFPCGWRGPVIELRRPPVLAVQSVQYIDAAGALQSLASGAWQLDVSTYPARLLLAPGTSWPTTQAGAVAAVRVAYTAGYGPDATTVPADLRAWMLLKIGTLYNTREADGPVQQKSHDFVDNLLNLNREMGV